MYVNMKNTALLFSSNEAAKSYKIYHNILVYNQKIYKKYGEPTIRHMLRDANCS